MTLTLTADLAMLRYSFEHRPLILGTTTALGAATAVGFYCAWRSLTTTGYRKLAEQTTPATTPPTPVPSQPGTTSP